MCARLLSHVQLFATPGTVARQVPLSMGFSRQEYWSRLPFPSPGDLRDPGDQTRVYCVAGRFFTAEPPGKPKFHSSVYLFFKIFSAPLRHLTTETILSKPHGLFFGVRSDSPVLSPGDKASLHSCRCRAECCSYAQIRLQSQWSSSESWVLVSGIS